MARRFKVEGTRDYLYWAIALFGLCLWAVRDGWFPTRTVLEKHPLETVASFPVNGLIEELLVSPGGAVNEKQPLARLRKPDLPPLIRAAEDAQARVRAAGAEPPPELSLAAEAADKALKEAREREEASELRSPVTGVVLSIEANRLENVSAGDPVVRIRPRDSFYIFNKSLAILALIGALVAAWMHWMSR
jgi:biotin carboxyl carrier protein